jgi:ATP-dependent DNA ligase
MMARATASFIEPMLLLRIDQLPDDSARWAYQLKLDGYRAVGFKTAGRTHFRSRNDNDFSVRYPAIVQCITLNETLARSVRASATRVLSLRG